MRPLIAMFVFATAAAAAANTLAAEVPPPEGEKIVSPDAKLELLFTRTADISGGLTEGPAVAADGSIYFSDIARGKDPGMILRFDPETKKTTVFKKNSGKTNGLMFDAQGRLVACQGADYGGRAIVRFDVETGKKEVLADSYQGKRLNAPNDLWIDDQGRIYFSDPRYIGHESRELKKFAVYRIENDGKLVEVTDHVEKPNGLAISADQKTLYVADHNNGQDNIDPTKPAEPGAMKVYAFPLGPDRLPKGKRKTLVDFEDYKGCDGMTLDEQGNIYLTPRDPRRPGVKVVNPQGKEIAFIPTGPSQPLDTAELEGIPSNVTFGVGDEANVLYITVDVSLYRIPLKVKGYPPPWARAKSN